MPSSPIASRTSSSLNGLMMAMTSFMAIVPTGRSLPWRGTTARWRRIAHDPAAQIKVKSQVGRSAPLPALAQQALLRDGGDERAVAGKDQPACQAAGA